jgi:hypothetical protein
MERQAIGEGQGSSTIKYSASLKNEISEQVVVQRNCGPRGLEMEAIRGHACFRERMDSQCYIQDSGGAKIH